MSLSIMRARTVGLICSFAIGFTLISVRLVYLQLISHERYREQSITTHFDRLPVAPHRGQILDRRGRVFAHTIQVIDLHIDGKLALESPEKLPEVARLIGMNPNELLQRLSPSRRWDLIVTGVDETLREALRSLRVRYLIFEPKLRRVYPNGAEGAHVVGFTKVIERTFPGQAKASSIETGVQGVEQVMNKYLTGIPGEQRIVRDARGNEIPAYRQVDRKPLNGLNVVLTLDQGVQHILEAEASKIVTEFSPESLSIIAVQPSTGEVLGLVNRPNFNPNETATRLPENIRNNALMSVYEPGSIFKIVTLAAVLNERIANLQTPVFCENGQFVYASTILRDSHPHGLLSVREAFSKSSNIAFAKLALQLRQERLYRYIRQMGFGDRVQAPEMALMGEEPGIIRPPQSWSQSSLTRIPIGYEVAVTNLQMVMAVAAIANEGKLMEPRFVRSVQQGEGMIVKQFMPKMIRQVVSREVCEQLTEAMCAVVDEGTGAAGAVPGLRIAGKTGTARKVIAGQYAPGAYYSSFVGFFPAENPQVVVSIVVDYPKGDKYYASQVAAPSFSRIATRVARHLDVIQEERPVITARRNT